MIGRFCSALGLIGLLTTAGWTQELPIRIDSNRNGAVYVRVVGEQGDFEKVSDKTPAFYPAKSGQWVDVRVIASEGFLWKWSGTRQAVTPSSKITVRMERSPAWNRLVPAGAGVLVLAGLGILGWRRRTAQTMAEMEQRARVAESGGGIPKRIGEYDILEEIGEGGMSHVYRGRDRHGVDYAIKVPKTVDERFLRECQIASKLNSPHIVRGFDFQAERQDGMPAYLVQEFLVGETLEERLEGTRGLPLDQVYALFEQLLEGLQAAHAESVLHRDLKPENIFLDRSRGSETLKILDFGVARVDDAMQLTVSGQMLGTALYASPEQNLSESVDLRSDLYSLGLVLYEMVTGERAWKASNRAELVTLHRAGLPTEAIALRPDLPTEWNRLICDLVQTEPEDRPPDVAAVKQRWTQP